MNAPDRLADLRINHDWAKLLLFDRSGWQAMRFEDIADNINERVDPAEVADDIYVGLEHLDSDSLHLRRWGKGSDVTGSKLRFRKGDVIFGRRRAYQRKLAHAKFDGICSAHAMVVRAKPQFVLPHILPFLMMSDRFMSRAVEISVGSLSPTINWKTLKNEVLEIPPLGQQRRFVTLFEAAYEAYERAALRTSALDLLKKSALEVRIQFNTLNGRPFPRRSLGDMLSVCQYGLSSQLSNAGRYPVLRMMNYDEERVAATELKFLDASEEEYKNYRVMRGDLLFNRTNSAELVGKVGIFELDGDYLFASYLVRLRTNSALLRSDFLNYFLNSESGQKAVRAFMTPGVSQSNISAGSLRKVLVPVPPLSEQQDIIDELSEIARAKRMASEHAQVVRKVLVSLINSVFRNSR